MMNLKGNSGHFAVLDPSVDFVRCSYQVITYIWDLDCFLTYEAKTFNTVGQIFWPGSRLSFSANCG